MLRLVAMTWSKTFAGLRPEIIFQINSEEFPAEAHPLHAVRQFIGAQLPTLDKDPIEKREYSVSVSGGTSESDGHNSANIFVSVTRGQVRQEPPSVVPVKEHVDAA